MEICARPEAGLGRDLAGTLGSMITGHTAFDAACAPRYNIPPGGIDIIPPCMRRPTGPRSMGKGRTTVPAASEPQRLEPSCAECGVTPPGLFRAVPGLFAFVRHPHHRCQRPALAAGLCRRPGRPPAGRPLADPGFGPDRRGAHLQAGCRQHPAPLRPDRRGDGQHRHDCRDHHRRVQRGCAGGVHDAGRRDAREPDDGPRRQRPQGARRPGPRRGDAAAAMVRTSRCRSRRCARETSSWCAPAGASRWTAGCAAAKQRWTRRRSPASRCRWTRSRATASLPDTDSAAGRWRSRPTRSAGRRRWATCPPGGGSALVPGAGAAHRQPIRAVPGPDRAGHRGDHLLRSPGTSCVRSRCSW